MTTYSYARCVNNAYRINWRIDELLGDKQFEPTTHWLSERPSGASAAICLSDDEERKLTHVTMPEQRARVGEVVLGVLNTAA